MFKYWRGYEIDGSDTSFNVLLPNREKLKEVLAFYFSLPIWDKSKGMVFNNQEDNVWAPHRDDHIFAQVFDSKEVMSWLDEAVYSAQGYLVMKCLKPECLSQGLQKEIYALSETRPGFKAAVNIRPSLGLNYALQYDEWLNVGLVIHPIGYCLSAKKELEGLVVNEKAAENNYQIEDKVVLSRTCGPSFIYEYAAYIVYQLGQRFPDVSIDGGLDCAGGFVDGCTYSTNLYAFESILLSGENIVQTIESLLQSKIICSVVIDKYRFNYSEKEFFSVGSSIFKPGFNFTAKNIGVFEYQALVESILAKKLDINETRRLCTLYIAVSDAKYSKPSSNMAFITVCKREKQVFLELVIPQQYFYQVQMQLEKHNIKYM